MTALGERTLSRLHRDVAVPAYDRRAATAGIVHLGVGNFHRAHQARYVEALLDAGSSSQWGIHGVGLLPGDRAMRDALAAQDGYYSLALRHNDGTWDVRVVGSILDYTWAPGDPGGVVQRLCDPRIRIVTITVTEGGWALDPATGRFDPADETVTADLGRPGFPTGMFGLVCAALSRRRAEGVPAFTIVSCDNIQGNGHVARRSFTGFARLLDADLARWMDDEVHFPNSMVDRITPRTTDDDRAALVSRFDLEDRWPVLCEPFTQWVLEDSFGAGRPPFEEVGVQLVDDVEPYELMKLRLLNAGHQALAYPSALIGHRLVSDAAADPLIAGFLLDYMLGEAVPTLRPVPGVHLGHYAHELIERFSNPEVRDTVARLCANTSDLIPKFLLPVIRANLAAGRAIDRSVAVVACWARYAEGVDEAGSCHPVVDARADRIRAAARDQRSDPHAFLEGTRDVFTDLVDTPAFTDRFCSLLRSIHERGVRATLSGLACDLP